LECEIGGENISVPPSVKLTADNDTILLRAEVLSSENPHQTHLHRQYQKSSTINFPFKEFPTASKTTHSFFIKSTSTLKRPHQTFIMHQYILQANTGFHNLKMVECPTPEVSGNDVLVKFHSASLNYRDVMIAQVSDLHARFFNI